MLPNPLPSPLVRRTAAQRQKGAKSLQRYVAALVAALAVLCAACGGSATPGSAPPAASPAAAPPAVGSSAAPAASSSTVAKALAPIRFSFSFIPAGNQASYYAALDRGYYKAKGLDVTLIKGVTPQVSVESLTSGHTDIGESDTSYAIDLITKGAPLKIIAVTFQQDPLGLVYLTKNPITTPTGIYGKTIGTFSGSEAEVLYNAFVHVNKLDTSKIKLVNISPNAAVGLLAKGKIDAFTGGEYTYGPPAAANGLSLGMLGFGQTGVPALGNCIVTTDAMIKAHPNRVRAFLYATAQGFAFAQAHPAQAAQDQAQATGIKAGVLEGSLKLSLQYLHAADTVGKPWGWTSPQDWQQQLQMMHQWMSLAKPLAPSAYHTNAYLPTGAVPAP